MLRKLHLGISWLYCWNLKQCIDSLLIFDGEVAGWREIFQNKTFTSKIKQVWDKFSKVLSYGLKGRICSVKRLIQWDLINSLALWRWLMDELILVLFLTNFYRKERRKCIKTNSNFVSNKTCFLWDGCFPKGLPKSILIIHINIHKYVCTYYILYMYIYLCVCVCVCVCVYMYIYIFFFF